MSIPRTGRFMAGDRVRNLRDERGTVVAAQYGKARVQVLWDTGAMAEEHRKDLAKVGRGRPRKREPDTSTLLHSRGPRQEQPVRVAKHPTTGEYLT